MAEITHDIPAVQAEYLRQNLAAMLLFALPPKDATDEKKADAYIQRIRPIMQCIAMLDEDHEIDWPCCEGCSKIIEFKEKHVTYSTEDSGSLNFCMACDPGDGEVPPELAHDPTYADHDIERARQWIADYLREPADA